MQRCFFWFILQRLRQLHHFMTTTKPRGSSTTLSSNIFLLSFSFSSSYDKKISFNMTFFLHNISYKGLYLEDISRKLDVFVQGKMIYDDILLLLSAIARIMFSFFFSFILFTFFLFKDFAEGKMKQHQTKLKQNVIICSLSPLFYAKTWCFI